MSRDKLSGKQIISIKKYSDSQMVISLVGGGHLLLEAQPTNWGDEAVIVVKKVKIDSDGSILKWDKDTEEYLK